MHEKAPTRPWIRRLSRTDPPGGIRLFCFPYAGGGAATFGEWPKLLPPEVDVYVMQPPGREDRLFERPVDNLQETLDAVVPELLSQVDGPFALFGHSLGAIVCWETARVLRDEHGVEPARLFLSGCRALPLVHDGRRDLYTLPDDELTEELRRMKGTPEEVLQNSDFMQLLLPAVRADYAMLARYSFIPGTSPKSPVTVFGGNADPAVDMAQLRAWSDLVDEKPDVQVLPGGHFFLHTSRKLLLKEIAARLLGPNQVSDDASSGSR